MAVRRPRTAGEPKFVNRIVGHGEMTPEQLQANPRNPRIHGAQQKAAMSAMLTDVGWVATVIVNRTTGLIIDGHMRVGLTPPGEAIPVSFVELTEAEESEVLALMDPIGNMASFDPDAIKLLTDGLSLGDALADMVKELVPASTDEEAVKPRKVELAPLRRAHVLVSIPLDVWDTVAPILDQLDGVDGIEVSSMVN